MYIYLVRLLKYFEAWVDFLEKIAISFGDSFGAEGLNYRLDGEKQCGRVGIGVVLNNKLGGHLRLKYKTLQKNLNFNMHFLS